MAFRVKYGSGEIAVDTVEDLRAVMKLMKEDESDTNAPAATNADRGQAAHAMSGGPSDRALLGALVNAGSSGVEAGRVGAMLGTRGRGVQPAIERWAVRMKLVNDGSSATIVESARIGTKRAWRLSGGMLDVGRHILGQK